MAGAGGKPQVYFSVTDCLGRIVEVRSARWNHVVRGHPEMTGQEQLVKDTLGNPETIHEGNTPGHKVFKGYRIPGRGFLLGGREPVIVVKFDASGKGDLTTAYVTALSPRGKVLWTRP